MAYDGRDPQAALEYDLEFDGRACNVFPLGAKKSREAAFLVMGELGKSMRQSITAGVHPVMMDMGALSFFLESAANEKLLNKLDAIFAENTQIESQPGSGDFQGVKALEDVVFSGSDGMGRWVRWLVFCLEVNCQGFFAESQRLGPTLKTSLGMKKDASPSPNTSPPSGSGTE